jgi:hypothetical protein
LTGNEPQACWLFGMDFERVIDRFGFKCKT